MARVPKVPGDCGVSSVDGVSCTRCPDGMTRYDSGTRCEGVPISSSVTDV